ncbi:MAG TPA: glycosyltransferase family 2 protein [Acidobacteriaceae bacterium]|nr:glycosyltransferase family 2 protein [Acidobacteriaceae bacterium]
MMLVAISCVAFTMALIPTAMFLRNLSLYREPPAANKRPPFGISVLIPARNEESSIPRAVDSLLRSSGVELEIVVMDDASTDRTAEIVRKLANEDSRIRLESAPALPAGWNGKQHACWRLAEMARHDICCFVDADVEVAPDALARMAEFLDAANASLVSGFPRQITVTFLEWLLLPLIHFVLLGFLPIGAMRRSTVPAYSAGCGQFMLVRRQAYFASGGHAAIRSSMHDGLLLPHAFREHGFRTDIADLTCLATCRMYRTAGEVWRGLSKNATEGLAAPSRILPTTILLLASQVVPAVLAAVFLIEPFSLRVDSVAWTMTAGALVLGYLPRILGVLRFGQSKRSALLHPAGVVVLLALQWFAFLRKMMGKQATWKQRAYPVA